MAQHHTLAMHEREFLTDTGSTTLSVEVGAQQVIERTHLLAALQGARDESAARARIMATVGHDVRQPLQAAMLVIERVKQAVDPAASARLDQALAMLMRLGDELGQLAQASQVELIGSRLHGAFPVADLFASLERDWHEHASAFGVVLRVRPSALRVLSDQAMLSTILRNLVGNALKFTPRGGRVLVGCRRRGAVLQLQVLDGGPGIAADKVSMIFEAFQRVDLADPREGLGLGLSIVKRTAEALGHGIEVRTAPGRGSCFAVNVPLALQHKVESGSGIDAEAAVVSSLSH